MERRREDRDRDRDRDREVHAHSESEAEEKRTEEGLADIGRKGGAAAAMAPGYAATRAGAAAAAVPVTRDLVRWAPVWAGLLVALPIQLILGAIGLAVSLDMYNPASANYAENVARATGIWSAISALIALFVGGFVAGRMAAVSGLRNGLTQGTLVWALSLVFGLILSALGFAGVLGANFNVGAQLARGVNLADPAAQSALRGAISGLWWFVAGAVLAWLAAAGGGILGAQARYQEVREEI